jgi:bifunctional DNase/RNase
MLESEIFEVYAVEMNEREIPDTAIVIKAREHNLYLPIWVAPSQAESIALYRLGMPPSRPLTYDLMAHLIQRLGGQLQSVQIASHQDNVFYATLLVATDASVEEIDCRPSDALALAAQSKVSIFCSSDLLEQNGYQQREFEHLVSQKRLVLHPRSGETVKSIKPVVLGNYM